MWILRWRKFCLIHRQSGGLLISVSKEDAQSLLEELQIMQESCNIVGRIEKKQPYEIYVKEIRYEKIIDARGKQCPIPVILVKMQ